MEHPFMKTLYAKTFDKGAYSSYLGTQYLMFNELEALCTKHRDTKPFSLVYDEALHRSSALAEDLVFWVGKDWLGKLERSEKLVAYLTQLRADASDPFLLLCHHFLQYNAVLSGGQYLGNMVSARAVADFGAVDLQGICFYDFPQDCQPTHARVQRYIDVVDGLAIPSEVRDRMLECMRSVYAHLLSLFDEAYSLNPVAGVSYNDSKNGKQLPPLPLDPLDASFTLTELNQHGVNTSPILTSVLGRVYDVTSGSELFGAGGPYEMFAGHDGTYNLAMMTLKKNTLDKFDGYEMDADDKECLADWLAYFDNRYGRPVGSLADKKHPISLSDLPRATKIPFSGQGQPAHSSPTVPASRL